MALLVDHFPSSILTILMDFYFSHGPLWFVSILFLSIQAVFSFSVNCKNCWFLFALAGHISFTFKYQGMKNRISFYRTGL